MISRPKQTDDDQRSRAGPITDSGVGPSSQSPVLGDVRGLVLGRDVRDAVLRHLTAALPHEGVGLLATTWEGSEPSPQPTQSSVLSPQSFVHPHPSPNGLARATRFYPGRNVDASPTRFTMDPAEVLLALREIDESSWWLGAIVHSHPAGPARPSPTDLREARYPDALTVIVSLAEQPPRLRAWRLPVGGNGTERVEPVAEVPVMVDGEPTARAQ
jgi:proteasome lid subunit RPN8/RPN11